MTTVKFKREKINFIFSDYKTLNTNIEKVLHKFWKKCIEGRILNNLKSILIIVKILDKATNKYITITPIQIINGSDYYNFLSMLLQTLNQRKDLIINNSKIIFVYKYLPYEASTNYKSQISDDPRLYRNISPLIEDNINGYNIPVTMDLILWGNEIHYTQLSKQSGIYIIHSISLPNITYKIFKYKPSHKWLLNRVEIKDITLDKAPLFFWDLRDKDDNDPSTFIRIGPYFCTHYIDSYKVFSISNNNIINNIKQK